MASLWRATVLGDELATKTRDQDKHTDAAEAFRLNSMDGAEGLRPNLLLHFLATECRKSVLLGDTPRQTSFRVYL
jgi:hypothetical protein